MSYYNNSNYSGGYNRPSYPVPSGGYNSGGFPGAGYSSVPVVQRNYQAPVQQTQFVSPGSFTASYNSDRPGRRKALLIGINYIGTQNELRGCINDANNMYNFLTSRYGYSGDDIVRLTDDQQNMVCVPTRANMIRAMHWLVDDAQPGDCLFFHYSGHGGQTKDLDGDEENGYDETILPVDFETQNVIIDDELNDIMVHNLPAGVRLTALFDSCHSGTALDLPYTYSTKGQIKGPNMMKEVGQQGLQAAMAYATGNRATLFTSLGSIVKTVSTGNKMNDQQRDRIRSVKSSQADVIMLSGSKDNQTSADAMENGAATGAMSYAFVKVLSMQPQQTYLSMLISMRNELAGKYSQKPQLSAAHEVDVNQPFYF